MLKKISLLLLSLVLCATITGCGKVNNKPATTENKQTPPTASTTKMTFADLHFKVIYPQSFKIENVESGINLKHKLPEETCQTKPEAPCQTNMVFTYHSGQDSLKSVLFFAGHPDQKEFQPIQINNQNASAVSGTLKNTTGAGTLNEKLVIVTPDDFKGFFTISMQWPKEFENETYVKDLQNQMDTILQTFTVIQ